jgi:hypothetical protein
MEIFIHHLACLGVSVLNFTVVPEYWELWPWAIIVEVNTVFLIGQRIVKAGPVRTLLRTLCLLTWFPCRFGVPYIIFHSIYLAFPKLMMWQFILSLCTMTLLAGMQIMWTQRLFDGNMIQDVLYNLFGIGTPVEETTDSKSSKVLNSGL